MYSCSTTSRFSASLWNDLSGSAPGWNMPPAALGFICDICCAIWLAAITHRVSIRFHGLEEEVPFSLPRIKMKTDCRPNKFKKYHDRLDTHRTSKSLVMTPDWSIDLKRIVSGKGSFTAQVDLSAYRASRDNSPSFISTGPGTH